MAPRDILLSQEGLSLYSCLEESLDEACPRKRACLWERLLSTEKGNFQSEMTATGCLPAGSATAVGIKLISTESGSGQHTTASPSITSVSSEIQRAL